MFSFLSRYARWLHTSWPAGVVEKLPEVREDGTTNVTGLYIAGDLTGIPLLKFAADRGTRVVRAIAADPALPRLRGEAAPDGRHVYDVVIVGGGVSGMAAALEAKEQGLDFVLLEAAEPFSTIANFPKGKPIFTYPTEMTPEGGLQPTAPVKEELLAELKAQSLERGIEPLAARAESVKRRGKLLEVVVPAGDDLLARRVVVAIGRSGNFRKLGVPGEDLDKVYNRLHDPKDFCGQDALVVGGGDSALETAIALAQCGARVTISYRKPDFSRPKPDNVERLQALQRDPRADVAIEEPSSERVTTATGPFLGESEEPGSIRLAMATKVRAITDDQVVLADADGKDETLPNSAVFSMIGREPPLDFFRRSGVKLRGETKGFEWVGVIGFFVAMFLLYDWKNHGFLCQLLFDKSSPGTFPNNAPSLIASLGAWWEAQVADRSTLVGTVAVSMKGTSFYYTLLYTLCVGIFGYRRVKRRRTPYVTLQTASLFLIQLLPLFLLPEVLLPWLGYNGAFDAGVGATVADALFERYIPLDAYLAADWPDWGHPRAYWRAYGFILAWPLSVYNVFTDQPVWAWLCISLVQTFVLIPLLVWRFGKGAYCGWICSCGGLAETMGDTQRHKMFHGPKWNRVNLLGQVLLGLAFVLFLVRVVGWLTPGSFADRIFPVLLEGKNADGMTVNPLSWKWTVDVGLAGILSVGLYFKFSGRLWCRFACPLAALMHVYARFSRFRIFADKKKCISCNLCTSVCHQGIDIMNFANKGLPMEDPECVRCSACVQNCPTGTLEFGQIDRASGQELGRDRIPASRVHMAERS
ncbi:MAG: NAD(P)-binding domain-containing protein [Planctomycetota bacterium]